MKLKYLIGAMALPALVASCSNEEILTEKGDNLAARPMAGDVTLAVAGGSVDSRWTSAGFEAGNDVIGAALMDNFSGSEDSPVYTLSNDIKTNYKFNYTEDGKWESDALFSEGNYFFYMQYNPDMRGRSGLYNTIPAIQKIGANGAAARYDNQLFLGYYFISGGADNLDLPVAMVETYAFPRVAATYEGANGVVIEKIVAKSNNFVLERQLDVVSALSTVPGYDANEDGDCNDAGDVAAGGRLNEYLSAFNNAVQNGYAESGVPAAVKKAVAAAMEPKTGKAVSSITIVPETAAATVDGAFVAPAGTYTGENAITFDIYTSKGIVTVAVPEPRYDKQKYNYSSEQYDVNTPENFVRYVAENFPTTFLAGEGGSSKKFEIFFLDGAITVPETLEVATVEELAKYLTNWYAGYDLNGTQDGKGQLTVQITEDIVLNDEVMAFLANTTTNPTIKFTTTAGKTLTIPATAVSSTINTVNAESMAVIIAEGAVQVANVGGTSATLGASKIINKGTLTIQADGSTAVTTIGTLANMGTLNVNTALTSSSSIINGYIEELTNAESGMPELAAGNANLAVYNAVNASATMNVSANVNKEVVSYGKLNVAADATIESVDNQKVYYAKGTSAEASKTAKLTIDEDTRLLVAGLNYGEVEADGILTAVGDFTNYGDIFNNYGIENMSGVELNNEGKITVAENAGFTIVNDNEGEIEILNRETEVTAISNKGTILYTADDASTFTVMADDRFNTVKFNGDKTIKVEGEIVSGAFNADNAAMANLKALTVKVAAKGKFVFDVTEDGSIAKFVVDGNVNATIASDVRITNNIEIKSGATIQLNRGYNLYFDNAADGSFVNNGTFRNVGTVYAACPQPSNFNLINFTGDAYKWSCVDAKTGTTLTEISAGTTELTGTTKIEDRGIVIAEGAIIDGNGYALIVPTGLDLNNVTIKDAVIITETSLESRGAVTIAADSYAVGIKGNVTLENCTFESPMTRYDIYLTETAENVTIKGCKFLTATADNEAGYGKRAIFSPSGDEEGTLTVEDCEFDDKVYAFNFNNTGRVVKFRGCEIKGWLSGHAGSFSFVECTFGKSGVYADFIPYETNVTFENCTFDDDFAISLKHTAGKTLTFVGEEYTNEDSNKPSKMLSWSYNGDGTLDEGVTNIKWGEFTAVYDSDDTTTYDSSRFSWKN